MKKIIVALLNIVAVIIFVIAVVLVFCFLVLVYLTQEENLDLKALREFTVCKVLQCKVQ